MEAYSLDLRERIILACETPEDTREEVADTFGVSRSFVCKLLARWRASGDLAPAEGGRGPAPVLAGGLAAVRRAVAARPDATLAELCAAVAAGGGPAVSRSTMCRAVAGLAWPLKKSPSTRPSATPGGCARSAAGSGAGSATSTRTGSCSRTRAGRTRR
jgi:transposase